MSVLWVSKIEGGGNIVNLSELNVSIVSIQD